MNQGLESPKEDTTNSRSSSHLFLVGYRGSGKTTVGKHLGKRLALQVYDSDQLIEATSGLTIEQIFSTHGEEEFRRLESEAIESFRRKPAAVVSLGGGAIIKPMNRSLIKSLGLVVWLRAPASLLFDRISADPKSQTQRPRLTNEDPWTEVATLLETRAPWYQEVADYIIDVNDRTPEQIALDIDHWLKTQSSFQPPNAPPRSVE